MCFANNDFIRTKEILQESHRIWPNPCSGPLTESPVIYLRSEGQNMVAFFCEMLHLRATSSLALKFGIETKSKSP